jgi:hypothetical protein
MKLFDILKQQGIFSNDLRIRINNGQIFINGEVIKENIELDVEMIDESNVKIIEAGDFVSKLLISKQKPNTNSKLTYGEIFAIQLKIFGIENLFDSNIDNELTKILNQHIIIKISKKEMFILKKIKKIKSYEI